MAHIWLSVSLVFRQMWVAIGPGVGWRQNVKPLIERGEVQFLRLASFWNPSSVDRIKDSLQGIEYVIHLAYVMPKGKNLIEIAARDFHQNVLGSLFFLSALPDSVKKIIFASSCMVYGFNAIIPVTERCLVNPISVYANGKFMTENYLRLLAGERNISTTILRLATVYGTYEIDPRAVPNFIRNVLAERPPVIYGDGNEVRDYINVKDVIDAIILSLIKEHDLFEIYNIGSGKGITTKEVAEIIIHLSGKSFTPIFQRKIGSSQKIICDISKARRNLGYSPSIELIDGLIEEIYYFRGNPRLWRK